MKFGAARKVTTTVRFDVALHDELNEFVHKQGKGLPPRRRQSKDSIVQLAVKAYIDASRVPSSELNDFADLRRRVEALEARSV